MIPAAALDFLRALAAHNEKPWFEANRSTYESAVRQPVAALVASVSELLAQRGLPLEGDPKRSSFRSHRDVRFSHDKRPYKTHVGSPRTSPNIGRDWIPIQLPPSASSIHDQPETFARPASPCSRADPNLDHHYRACPGAENGILPTRHETERQPRLRAHPPAATQW